MCFKPSLQYKVIVLCGILVAAFGIIMLIMAINITVKSAWLTDLLEDQDPSGGMAGLVKAFQAVVYVVGIYLLIIGGASVAVYKQKKKCCNFLYACCIPAVIILMLVMAIPALLINSITEDNIAEICTLAANSDINENDRSMVIQGTKRKLQALDNAKDKANDMKNKAASQYSAKAQQAEEWVGPMIKSMDNALDVSSAFVMCKKDCPCAKITDDSSYSKEAKAAFAKDAAAYAKLNAKQKEDFTGFRFDGKIKNFDECMTALNVADAKKAV